MIKKFVTTFETCGFPLSPNPILMTERTVVMPRLHRPAASDLTIQKATHEHITIMKSGV
jgi:hypothetical protein